MPHIQNQQYRCTKLQYACHSTGATWAPQQSPSTPALPHINVMPSHTHINVMAWAWPPKYGTGNRAEG